MEAVLFFIEVVLWVVDVLVTFADVYSWIEGKQNRSERREARKVGSDVPPRDHWNRRVIVLTIIVCVLTVGLIIWKS